MAATDIRLWTVEEYHRMLEADILTERDRVELLDKIRVTRTSHALGDRYFKFLG
jgi:hypothetical protein